VKCQLCPHGCDIREGGFGFCGARQCLKGEILPENYGQITSLALDPIEKKPLYHFHPGSRILSVGSYGCNMCCTFCQNHNISQVRAASQYVSPEKLAALAAGTPDNLGVAFTYNEPLISYEYILQAAPLIHANGQKVVLVSNGQINSRPLETLLPHVDAWNIDIKAFTPEFYRRHGGDLAAAKATVEGAAKTGHVEVTTLVIPGENDGENEIASLAHWLAGLSPDIPYHLSRFFPRHKMTDKPPTPKDRLLWLADIARQQLKHVYVGNL
jgi:pyruvate formate lyase activating enzyme